MLALLLTVLLLSLEIGVLICRQRVYQAVHAIEVSPQSLSADQTEAGHGGGARDRQKVAGTAANTGIRTTASLDWRP